MRGGCTGVAPGGPQHSAARARSDCAQGARPTASKPRYPRVISRRAPRSRLLSSRSLSRAPLRSQDACASFPLVFLRRSAVPSRCLRGDESLGLPLLAAEERRPPRRCELPQERTQAPGRPSGAQRTALPAWGLPRAARGLRAHRPPPDCASARTASAAGAAQAKPSQAASRAEQAEPKPTAEPSPANSSQLKPSQLKLKSTKSSPLKSSPLKSSPVHSSQAKPSQACKPSRAKSSQAKPSQLEASQATTQVHSSQVHSSVKSLRSTQVRSTQVAACATRIRA